MVETDSHETPFKHLGEFISKCGWGTILWVGGGVALSGVISWLASVFWDTPPKWFTVFSGVCLGIVFAAFSAWRSEKLLRVKRVKEEMDARKLERQAMGERIAHLESEVKSLRLELENNIPKLIGEVVQTVWGDATFAHQPGRRHAILLAVIGIANSGKPSVAKEWILTGKRNGVEFKNMGLAFTENETMSFRGEITKIPASEALYEKTAYTPIPNGGRVIGWMKWVFLDCQLPEFVNELSDLQLEFSDVDGKRHVIKIPTELRGENINDMYIPGITNYWQGMDFRTNKPIVWPPPPPASSIIGSTLTPPSQSHGNEQPPSELP